MAINTEPTYFLTSEEIALQLAQAAIYRLPRVTLTRHMDNLTQKSSLVGWPRPVIRP
jgi:hypothetical protein